MYMFMTLSAKHDSLPHSKVTTNTVCKFPKVYTIDYGNVFVSTYFYRKTSVSNHVSTVTTYNNV